MRDVRFRGKNINTGEWVYGYFKKNAHGDCYIEDESGVAVVVDPDTVGQFVCKDAMGNDVYEGDIVRHVYNRHSPKTGKVTGYLVDRYRVYWLESNFVFLIKPLGEGGAGINANYIEDWNMVKEVAR